MESEDKKELSRREFLAWMAAAAAMLALPGCDPNSSYASAEPAPARYRPPVASTGTAYASTTSSNYSQYLVVPDPPPAIMLNGSPVQPTYVTSYASPQYQYAQPAPMPAQVQPQPQVQRVAHYAPPAPAAGRVSAVSRNSWGATPAVPTKMKAMNGVRRITIHHEGSAKPNNDTTPAQVSATLRLIQSQHRKRMGAGDIGYHFIIDRTGTIWQGRDWQYQGAHTSGANSNNLGVMLLGNFEIQQPTGQQLQSLQNLVRSLVRLHRLNPRTDIYGHSDFCNTQCPGKHLKVHVQTMRRTLN